MAFVSPRKVLRAKQTPQISQPENSQFKSVTFSDETIETSIGGTQRIGKIKKDLLLHFDVSSCLSGASKSTSQSCDTGTASKAENVSVGKENKESVSDASKTKACETAVSSSASSSLSSKSNTETFQSPSTRIKPTIGKSRVKEKSSDKLNTTVEKKEGTNNANLKANRNSKDFLGSNDKLSDHKMDGTACSTTPRVKRNSRDFLGSNDNLSDHKMDGTTCSTTPRVKRNSRDFLGSNDNLTPGNRKNDGAGNKFLKVDRNSKDFLGSNDSLSSKKSDGMTTSNRTPRVQRNSKDFLGSNDNLSEKIEDSSSDSSLSVKDDPRKTMDHIESIALTPFQAPHGKNARRHTLESKLFSTPDCFHDVSFDRAKLFSTLNQEDQVQSLADGEDSCSVVVAVRVRPFCERELRDSNCRCAVQMQSNETTVVSDTGATHRFVYDFSFWSHDQSSGDYCDQEAVYARLAQPLLGKAFEGYNTCLFAYGQTGSGKSYSILGSPTDVGIIPRFCSDLFSRADMLTTKKKVKVKVEISFFEIYQEKIHDLLASNEEKGAKKITLDVREHPVLGPYVEGLSTYVVNSFEEVKNLITKGGNNRFTAATEMNLHSSRSHSVFTIVLSQTKIGITGGQEHELCVNSKINLVDLAGSERQSTANTSGERLREGASINKSLLTLGKVIYLLCERSQQGNKKGKRNKKDKMYIPYRDSLLTWLLKESLGGNSKTAMIATISPSNQHLEETLSTLRYAQQARSIVNVVRINEVPKDKLIRQLLNEIEQLRAQQKGTTNEDALAASTAEIARLKQEMEELRRSLKERLLDAEIKKAEELKSSAEKSGLTFKVDNTLPNLVNLSEAPQISEMLLYVLKEGETRVGRNIDNSDLDIKLMGDLIADNHCVITNKKDIVEITPIDDAPTYINGNLLSQTTVLHHGDRVILGEDHYFRFNHPMEVQKTLDKEGSNSDIKDYEFAKEELHRVQTARVQELLDVEGEKSRQELQQLKKSYENKLRNLETALAAEKERFSEAQGTIKKLKEANVESNKEAQATISHLKHNLLMLEKKAQEGISHEKLEQSHSEHAWSRWEGFLVANINEKRKRLEYARRKKLEASVPATLVNMQKSILGSPGSKRDLCGKALSVREANKISQQRQTNMEFYGDYLQTDNPNSQVRAVNINNLTHALLPWSKFEEKLAALREGFQHGDNGIDNEVFNDPDDVWEKVPCPTMSSNSLSKFTNVNELPKTPVFGLRTGITPYSPRSTDEIELTLVKTLKYLLSSSNSDITATEESPVDKVLIICQRMKQNIELIAQSIKISKKAKKGMGAEWSQPMSVIVVDVHTLTLLTSQWYSDHSGTKSSLVKDLLDQAADWVSDLRRHSTSLLQACEGQLVSLTTESGHKLAATLLSLCETCGGLALATQTNVQRIGPSQLEHDRNKLSSDVVKSFVSGCNRLATHVFESGLTSLEQLEHKCDDIARAVNSDQKAREMSRRLKHVLSCIQALVQKTLKQGLAQEALHGDQKSPQFYEAVYARLQKIVSSVLAVVKSSKSLLMAAESVLHGSGQDSQSLQKCMEKLLHHCQQLMPALSLTYTQTPTLSGPREQPSGSVSSTSSSSWSSVSSTSDMSQSSSSSSANSPSTEVTTTLSDLTEVSFLSESQLSFLDSAVQEVAMASSLFSEYLTDTWGSRTVSKFSIPDLKSSTKQNATKRIFTTISEN
uniref:Kinesin-like protein KIF14 n=1 Tax=Biomphalaria glabrata TaxID=6526 RepID=A0A2C9K9V3_BIOGL|nr:kinesin-like protein KIF14 [Biomphalaria glabrata]